MPISLYQFESFWAATSPCKMSMSWRIAAEKGQMNVPSATASACFFPRCASRTTDSCGSFSISSLQPDETASGLEMSFWNARSRHYAASLARNIIVSSVWKGEMLLAIASVLCSLWPSYRQSSESRCSRGSGLVSSASLTALSDPSWVHLMICLNTTMVVAQMLPL